MFMFIATYGTIGTHFTFYLIVTGLNIFICPPRERFWNVFREGSCYNWGALMKATSLFNVISDINILVLPIPSIWKLQVVPKKKIGISVVFAAGVL